MTFSIILTLTARQNELDAYSYYESQRPGLGEEYLIELESIYAKLSRNPFVYSYIDGRRILRDAMLARFLMWSFLKLLM